MNFSIVTRDHQAAVPGAVPGAAQPWNFNQQVARSDPNLMQYYPNLVWGGLPFCEGQQLPDFSGLQQRIGQQPVVAVPAPVVAVQNKIPGIIEYSCTQ